MEWKDLGVERFCTAGSRQAGSMEQKKQKGKQQHIFEETNGEFLLNWWPSSKTYAYKATNLRR